MKKYILPVIALMLVAGVANAQVTKKPATTHSKTTTTKPSTTTTSVTPTQTKPGTSTAIKKKHHKKHKSAKPSGSK